MLIPGGQMVVINPLLFLCGFKIELILKVKEKKRRGPCLSLLFNYFSLSSQLSGLILTGY